MNTFYLRKLKQCIRESIRFEANVDTQTFHIIVDHPRLLSIYSIDTHTQNLYQILDTTYIKAVVHTIMQEECDECRKALRQIGNFGYWLALIMAIITLIWLC